MPYSTLISCYGSKPSEFIRLIGECQATVARMLGEHFHPYNRRQVHCTIAALDRVGESGLLNAAFCELRGQRIAMDLAGLLDCLRKLDDLEIQIGGFAPDRSPFVSRGLPPYQRSFCMQDGKAVIIGWPIDRRDRPPAYPPRLESLRRSLQQFGVLHRYHAKEIDVDNDFYLRIGLYDPSAVTPALQAEVEDRVRALLSGRPPLVLPLRKEKLAFAQSNHQTLPPTTTTLLPVADPKTNPRSIARLFGWDGSL